MRFIKLTLLLAAVLALPRAAAAQTLEPPRARQGYYIALGLSAAAVNNWYKGDGLGVWGGNEITVRFGEMVTRRFGLGLQIDSGAAKGKGYTGSLIGLAMQGQYEIGRNFAAHGGLGFGSSSYKPDNDETAGREGTSGAQFSLGLSWDWFFTHRTSGGWALTPFTQARYLPGTKVDALVVLFGAEISWWSGLPRNQLALPDNEAYKKAD